MQYPAASEALKRVECSASIRLRQAGEAGRQEGRQTGELRQAGAMDYPTTLLGNSGPAGERAWPVNHSTSQMLPARRLLGGGGGAGVGGGGGGVANQDVWPRRRCLTARRGGA